MPLTDPTSALDQQVANESSPNIAGDQGQTARSSPSLAAAAPSSLAGVTTNLTWGQTASNIAQTDQQAANQQTQYLIQKQTNDAFAKQEAELTKREQAAELQGKKNDALMQARAATLRAQMRKQGLDFVAKLKQLETANGQNYTSALNSLEAQYGQGASSYGQGTGAVTGSTGVSAEGRSQLSIARADGYNLGSGNYDRTYHYNNSMSSMRNQALGEAYSALGTHYVLGGERNQVAMDCSGLVQMIYSQLGFNVPLHSAAHESGVVGSVGIPGVRTAFENLQPGDLVCWRSGDHIAIYAGNNEIIEAANTKVGTVRRAMWDSSSNVFGIHLTFTDEQSGSGHNGARGQGRR